MRWQWIISDSSSFEFLIGVDWFSLLIFGKFFSYSNCFTLFKFSSFILSSISFWILFLKIIFGSKFSSLNSFFSEKFAKLQEKYGDMDHQTQIHLQPCENISCRNKSVKTTIEPLSIQEICLINPKLWNAAIKVDDMETNSSFSIINASYDGEKLEFICKDSSDSIYKCSVNGIGYGKQKIYLGTPRKKSVYRPGDDRTLAYPYWDEHWDNVATFDGWDELCNEL